MKSKILLLLLMGLLSAPVYSEWTDSVQQGWDKSKAYSAEVWDDTKKALSSSKEIFSESEAERKQSRADQEDERFREMWASVFQQLEEGLQRVDDIKAAPDSAFFSDDKVSLTEDLDVILDKTILLLEDESINDYRQQIQTLNEQIEVSRNNISTYREQKIMAPRSHMVKTTKQDYDDKIAEEQLNIKEYELQSEKIKTHLKERMKDVGIELNDEQIGILLARVDADDIIQMSVIFDVLKKITTQLMQLTRESGEDVKYAKKYYGMHVVLLELVNHMQNKYIAKVDSVYIPRIEQIIGKTEAIQKDARKHMNADSDPQRIAHYQKNIRAQLLTLKTARLYRKNLEEQKNKVVSAQKVVRKNLNLSQNTYDTVEVSADLLAILKTSQDDFDTLMNLQVPQIVPFENIQMQDKYQELSRLLKER
ncbi:MAG: hypothetical protein KZQ58_07785 [gamma proteobacterium symbiont of Bathyaustriella thionipta]|nr:hypothetical protein [gamma proteobacterium symbiont of Bathyaustriella thionipta]